MQKSFPTQTTSIYITIGNTYEKLKKGDSKLKYDSTGKFLKYHYWTLYLTSSKEEFIKKVEFNLFSSFSPSVFTKVIPPFQTTQTSFASLSPQIKIHFIDGTCTVLDYDLNFGKEHSSREYKVPVSSNISKSLSSFLLVEPEIPKNITYGVELELIVTQKYSKDTIVKYLSDQGVDINTGPNSWKIVNDNSIQCSISMPDCFTFEIVSPILSGYSGIDEIRDVMKHLGRIDVKVNKTAGFHVHIGAPKHNNSNIFKLGELRKVCQNWLKYEEAFDLIIASSRRDNKYCQSNRNISKNLTNKEVNEAIGNATLKELIKLMNGDDRYKKLNLLSLHKHQTIEFRLHQGTHNVEKITNWILLLLIFVRNSCSGKVPDNFKSSTSPKEKYERLFQWVINDRYLYEYYNKRMKELGSCGQDMDCDCQSCSNHEH
jgi:hypothetical protein